jgi:aryl-alcohol dehydrogenase-like predicted oxidoreductase
VVIELLERIGAEKGGATPDQIALAWVLAQKTWIVPIPGSRRLAHLDDNLGSLDIALTADDLDEIDHAMSRITVVGNRY